LWWKYDLLKYAEELPYTGLRGMKPGEDMVEILMGSR
jgi:hypothetical protein